MEIKERIIRLSEACGASGSEDYACQTALEMLREYVPDARIDNGNVVGRFGEFREGLPSLLLDAHIDQVGFIVTYITDEGFVKFGNLGGIDRRLLPAQQVVIHGKNSVKGVICSVPPHLGGSDGVPQIDEFSIDTGMTAEELKKIVSPGDSVTFDIKCRELLGNRLTGCAMDDRSGIAAILYALELLRDSRLSYNVTVLFSAQEELGERGAKIGAYKINPDVAIAVDVSFGYAVGETEHKCGYMGKGPMIGISPSLSREISDGLIKTAGNKGIPYQLEVMNGLTSTNADRFAVNREGAKACTVSIPLRYMHTPVEVIDVEDVKLTGELLAEFIKEAE
ncbi:MAG: M20/M25/M40 family metallo-hydrolase [Ruminococcus sp.]|nr:M20/M25/M40 family metallo-hydrolase [Ruminococcus sp.]